MKRNRTRKLLALLLCLSMCLSLTPAAWADTFPDGEEVEEEFAFEEPAFGEAEWEEPLYEEPFEEEPFVEEEPLIGEEPADEEPFEEEPFAEEEPAAEEPAEEPLSEEEPAAEEPFEEEPFAEEEPADEEPLLEEEPAEEPAEEPEEEPAEEFEGEEEPGEYSASGPSYSYISFDANGGSGWMESIYLEDAADTWLAPACEFTYPGRHFIGWGLTPEGPVAYLPGDRGYNDGSMTLYALWADMSDEELAELYAPKNVWVSYTSITVDEETGAMYTTVHLGWDKVEDVDTFHVDLNLGGPDGPRVPGLGTALSRSDGSVTTYWSSSYANVAAQILEPGGVQTVTDGVVNGLVDGDVLCITLSAVTTDGRLCPGPSVFVVCEEPYSEEVGDDSLAWFAETGNGTVEYDRYEATVTLLKDTVLPAEGLTLPLKKSVHFRTADYTLTGAMTSDSSAELFFEQPSDDGGLMLALYACGQETYTFDGFGLGASPVGSATVTFNGYGQAVYDPTLATVTVINGTTEVSNPWTVEDVQNWGYVNTAEPVTWGPAPLSDEELAAHIPQNLAVTPTAEGFIAEWDNDPVAIEGEIKVQVLLDDGSAVWVGGSGPRTVVAPGYGPDRYTWSTSGGKNRMPIGVEWLGEEDEQTIHGSGENRYVDAVKPGQTVLVSAAHVLGAQYQMTPFCVAVSFPYSQSAIGKTFTATGQLSRLYLANGGAIVVDPATLTRVYNGQAQTLDYSVTYGGATLTKGVDYVERYTDNVKPGTAALTVMGAGLYAGEVTQPFTIAGLDLNGPDASVRLAFTATTYNGRNQEPDVTVLYGSTTLKKNDDFTLSYSDNKAAGIATVTVTGRGVYAGTRNEHFTINARSMTANNLQATLSQNRFARTGEPCKPEVSVKWGSETLTEGTDYTVAFVNNTEAGVASVVLTGTGNYCDERTLDYTIFEVVDLATAAVFDPIADSVYDGTDHTPEVTLRVGQKILVLGRDYSLDYSNNRAAGTATVTATGRGDYTGEAVGNFTIRPADVAGCEMTLSKDEYPYGEAVYTYSIMECMPRATVTFGGRTLSEGTDYVLSYRDNIDVGTAYAVAEGTGNFSGTLTAPFTINPANLEGLGLSFGSAIYNGQAQTPRITLYQNYYDPYQKTCYLTEGEDYEVVSWADNVNAGTATVTLRALGGNYAGTRDATFTVSPFPMHDNDFEIDYAQSVLYTGQPINPIRSVKWKLTGETLVEGRDYTVGFEYGNTDVGDNNAFRIEFTGNFENSGFYYSFNICAASETPPTGSQNYYGTTWSIDENGTLHVDAGGGAIADLGYGDTTAWRLYRNAIKKIVVTNTTKLTQGSFDACRFATEAVLPDGLEEISYSVFTGCDSLVSVNIPDTVTKLNAGTFPNNHKLEVHLPDNITAENFDGNFTDTGAKGFVKPGTATEATLRSSWSEFYYEGYPDFRLTLDNNNPEDGLWMYRYEGSDEVVQIPDFIDYMYGYGLSSNSTIRKIIIPGTVSKLGVVQYSTGLREIVIEPGNRLTEIPYHFIDGCDNITIYIPDNITSFGGVLNYYSNNNMLIVANCGSYAIEWAQSQMSYGSHVWKEEDGTTGPRYRIVHKNLTHHDGQAPTCEATGWAPYDTCTCGYSSYAELPAFGHDWGAATYTWAADQNTVTATHTCTRDASHTETETVNTVKRVTLMPTCEAAGVRTYTAVFTNPAFATQTRTEPIPATNHTWGAPTYTWSADLTRVTARRVCGIDERHVETETVNTTPRTVTPANCESAGVRAYDAHFTNPAFSDQTRTAAIPALGHSWGAVTYTWADDNSRVTASRTCTRDASHVQSETVNTAVQTTAAPTCEGAGMKIWIARFSNPAFLRQTRTGAVPAVGHDWGEPVWTWNASFSAATATFTCRRDESHTVTLDATVTSATTPATPAATGRTVYTAKVTLGGREYSDTREKILVAAPVLISATASGNSIVFKWGAVDGAAKYRVYRKTGSGSWAALVNVAATSYTDTNITAGTTYTYTARCLDASGNPCSSFDTTGKSATAQLAAPVLISATASGSSIVFKWNAVAGASKYRVYRKTGTGNWAALANVAATSYTDTKVTAGTTYTYTARCLDASGNPCSNFDTTGKSATVSAQLAAPTLVSATAGSSGIVFKWNAVAGAAKYRVYRKYGTVNWTVLGDVTGTSYTDANVTAGTTYTYTVRCVNAAGQTVSGFDAAGKSATAQLAAPVLISATASGNSIVFKWNAVAGAAKYRVYRKYMNVAWTAVANVTGTSYTDTNVTAGVTYTYTARCLNAAGQTVSDYDTTGKSAFVSLAAPTLVSATVSGNTIVFKWNAVAGASKYRVYRKYPGVNWTVLGDVAATSYTDTNVTAGTTYTYTVRCVNAAGNTVSGFDATGKSAFIQLAAPVLISATASGRSIVFKWNSVAGAAKYRVYRKTGTGSWTAVANVTGTSYTDTNVTGGTTYTYTVRCLNAAGQTVSGFDATGKSATAQLAAPTLVSATAGANGIVFKWNAVAGAAKYRVYRKTGTGSWIAVANVTGTSYTDTNVTTGTTYTYTVRCLNAAGQAVSGYNTTGLSIRA